MNPTQAPMNNRATPRLMDQIDFCHRELSLLHESLEALNEGISPVCDPPVTKAQGPGTGPMPPPVEVAPAIVELMRLRERISSLNASVQALISRIAI